jgi:nucleotide-binding universal stress UspA family protein
MASPLVVLTDFYAVTNRALSYAAGLAVPLQAQLILLHVRYDGLPESVGHEGRHTPSGEAKTKQALLKLAAAQTVATTVDVAEGFLPAAVNEAVRRHHPLLVVLARPAAAPEPAELLTSVVQDVLRHAPYPLLLVPTPGEGAPFPPRRLLLAVDGLPFTLNDQSHQEVLSQLLQVIEGTLDVVHVTDDGQARPKDGAVLATVQANDLVSILATNRLHQVYHPSVVEGVLEEAARQEADMLVVVARRHTLFGSLFHTSITTQLIEQSPIPVLVLPAED